MTDDTEPTCDICEQPADDHMGDRPTEDWNHDTGCHRSCEARAWAERGPDDDDLAAAGMIGEGGGGGSYLAAWRESDEAHR